MTPDAMAALHARCFTDTPRPWTEAEIAGFLERPTSIAVRRGAGFALGRIAGPEAELLTLAVAPEARRAGLGSALVADYEAQAARRGAEEAFLEVAESNAAARALYAAAGYVAVGRRPGYFVRPAAQAIDAIVMRKRLSDPLRPRGKNA